MARLTRLVAALLNAPMALIALVDDQQQLHQSAVGFPEPLAAQPQFSLAESIHRQVAAAGEPVVVSAGQEDLRLPDRSVLRDLGVAAYLAAPLANAEGDILGFVCTLDSHPRTWAEAEVCHLKDLAAVVMSEVELRRANCSPEPRQQLSAPVTSWDQHPAVELGFEAIFWEATADPLRFTYVSHHAVTLLGYPTDCWLETADFWINLIHPEDRERVVRDCAAAVAQSRDHQVEYRAIAADGRVVWLRDLIQVIARGAGQATQLRGVMVDITAQKELEAHLQFQTSLLQAQNEAILEGVLVVSPEGRPLSFNQRFLELWGVPSEAVLAYSSEWLFRSMQEQLAEGSSGWPSALEPACAWEVTRRDELLLKDGRILEQYTAPVRGESGYLGRIWRFRDITDRKRAQEVIEASERRFRALIENSTDLITVLTSDGTVLYYSPSVYRLLGYEQGELDGKNAFELVHPHDRDELMGQFRQLVGQPPYTTVITAPFRFLHKDSSWRYFEAIGRNLLHDPALSGIVVNSRDITERVVSEEARRNSEAQYRRIVETTSEGVWLVDTEGRTTFVNERMAEMLGYSVAEMVGRLATEFVPDELQEETAGRIVQQGQGLWPQVDTRCVRKDGSPLWVFVSATPVRDAEGQVTGVLAMVSDISARKQAEMALQASAERLRTLSRQLLELQESERRHLARELHDELGQSLTLLKINLGTVTSGQLDPALAATLQDGIALADQMLQQVRDLSLDLRPSVLDDLGLKEALNWYVERFATRSGVSVKLALSLSGERFSPRLETAVFRVVQEALTNSVRHAGAQQIEVDVHRSGNKLHLSIHDNGCGFDVEDARRRAVQGQSVGIMGMEERVLLAGGDFEIQSLPGNGTRISATFPLVSEQSAELPDFCPNRPELS